LLLFLCKCNFSITGECNNKVYKEVYSPNKINKIVKFDRECGATVANSIQLSVISYKDTLPNESGNLFITNSKVGGYIETDTSVSVFWLNDTTVKIKYDKDLDIFKKDTAVNKIKIFYEVK
jgi:hypothetical protein